MSKKITKVVSVLLCVAMIFGCVPVMVFAADSVVATNGNGGATDVGAWYTTYNTNDFWGDNGRFSNPSSAKVGYKALKSDGSYGVPYSQDVSEIDFQIKKMAEAGIDFIVFDLTNGGLSDEINYGTGDNLAFILNNAKLTCERISLWNDTHSWKIRYAVSVGIYANLRAKYVGELSGYPYTQTLSINGIDTLCATLGLAAELQAEDVLNEFVQNETYGDDYYMLDNKPLLVLHETGTDRATASVASYTGDKTALNQFAVRDSNSRAQKGTYGWYTSGSVADNNNCGTFADDEVMLVSPGQCNHSNGNNTPNAYRENGEHYKANWDAVLENSPRIVMISSLNDYMEDTSVWPTVTSNCTAEEKWESPYQYWDLTVDYINALRTANGDTATTAAERSGNVALGATVTANNALEAYPVNRLTDGLIDYDRTTETTGITRYDSNGIGYFEVTLNEATAINQVKVFRTTWESNYFPKDIAIDVKNSKGSWKRVAEMHDIEANLPHDLTFNFKTVSDVKLIRVSANKARNSSSNFRVSEIEAYNNTTLTSEDYTGIIKDATYNIPEMISDNLIAGMTAVTPSGRGVGSIEKLTDGDYAFSSSGQTYVLYGAGNLNNSEANNTYYQFDFDEETRLNLIKLYLSSTESDRWPQDIAVDVKLSDGSWKRVAANYNISYKTAPTDNITVSSGGVVQNSRLEFTFESISCVSFRLTANRQRVRATNSSYASGTLNWRLVEIMAYNDPSITKYTGIERPDDSAYAIPAVELVNYALGATVTSKGQVHSGLGAFSNLTDGNKNNRTGSYYYNGTTTPTDEQCVNYYDITFAAVKEINRVDVIYSIYADDDRKYREKDIAIDVITPDGRYVRVAEKHDFSDAVDAAHDKNYTLSLTFDNIIAAGVRITANCKQSTRYLGGTANNTFMVHAEVEVYNDPNIMSNTGIEEATVGEIPLYKSVNYALNGTVSSTNTNESLASSYPVSKLTDGKKAISSDCGIINYVNHLAAYEIAFDGVKTLNQVVLYLSQYEPEKLPLDIAVYAKADGEWIRVAEKHGIDYTGAKTLEFNFGEIEATAIKVKATNTTNTASTNFRLVEIEAYYNPFLTEADYNTASNGDINDDVLINADDLIIVQKILLDVEDSYQIDINKDGKENILDFIVLKKLLAA